VSLRSSGLVVFLSTALVACAKGRSAAPSSAALSAEVEVPAPPAGRQRAEGEELNPRAERSARNEAEQEDEVDDDDLEIEIARDGGTIQFLSSNDGSVRVWGTFTQFDGGFSFQGGFSAGFTTGDGGP